MNYTLTLTPAQIQVIANALAQMPWHIADPMIREINRQTTAQHKPEQPA